MKSNICMSVEEHRYDPCKISGRVRQRGPARRYEFEIVGADAIIPLLHGKSVVIDAADLQKAQQYTWCVRRCGYATSGLWVGSRYITVMLHRLIVDAPPGLFVDHVDGDKLNNRRSNLRLVTARQNTWNRRPSQKALPKGVTRLKHGKYQAQCSEIYLGVFDTPEEAAAAYEAKAKELYGDFRWRGSDQEPRP